MSIADIHEAFCSETTFMIIMNNHLDNRSRRSGFLRTGEASDDDDSVLCRDDRFISLQVHVLSLVSIMHDCHSSFSPQILKPV